MRILKKEKSGFVRPPRAAAAAAAARRRTRWGPRARQPTSLSRVRSTRVLGPVVPAQPHLRRRPLTRGRAPGRPPAPGRPGVCGGAVGGWVGEGSAHWRLFPRARCLPVTANRPSPSCFLVEAAAESRRAALSPPPARDPAWSCRGRGLATHV